MNFKKLLIVSLVAFMTLGCVSTASAGWFDFLSGEEPIDNDVIDIPNDVINVTYEDDSLNFIQIFAHITQHRKIKGDIKEKQEVKGYKYEVAGSSTEYELKSEQLDLTPNLFSIEGTDDASSFNETLNKIMENKSFNPANSYIIFYDKDNNEIHTKNLTNASFSITKNIPKTEFGEKGGYFVTIKFNEKLNNSYKTLYSKEKGKGKLYLLLDSENKKYLVTIPLNWDTNENMTYDFVN
ncbi:MAG: hypothetical protein IJJ47_03005 [Methanosphaera sp.]|nr:hypothetical protein [Methanosphaera sp.]